MLSLTQQLKKSYRTTVFILSGVLVGMFVLYGFLVRQTIMNVVERREKDTNIALVHADIGALESRYIALSNTIDLSLAYEQGFHEATSRVTFVSRAPERSVALGE